MIVTYSLIVSVIVTYDEQQKQTLERGNFALYYSTWLYSILSLAIAAN